MITKKVKGVDVLEESVSKPEETWESNINATAMEFIKNMLSVSKECELGTVYSNVATAVYETHTEYGDKVDGAELRLIFKFVEPIDLTQVNLIKG